MSDAMIGSGTIVELETAASAGTYDVLGEITDVTPPEITDDLVEVTHMSSPGGFKEYISGLSEGGEGQFNFNWVPGATTEDKIEAWRVAKDVRNIRITFPNNARETWPSIYRGFSRTTPVGDKLSGTLTAKAAGAPTRDTAG